MKKPGGIVFDKALIVNATVIILIVVFYFSLFLRPTIKELFILLPQAAQLKTKIVNTERKWAGIDSLKEKIFTSKTKIEHYEKKLPMEKEIPSILEYLSAAAKKMDVRIAEIKPVVQDEDKISQDVLYYAVPISLKAECGYHQLGRFLNILESADRFIKISDMKIVANPRKADIHNVQLVLVTYVMKK